MSTLYDYLNYRLYLRDYYNEQKKANPAFSYQYFALRAGFKSRSFLKLVIDGKKNLTNESMEKINRVLKLSPKAFSYFSDMVALNQAKSLKIRNSYFSKLSGYNRRNKAKMILAGQYEYFSKWYHLTVRELAAMIDFKEDYELLGKMVKPRISARQARQSVGLLLKLGLLRKTGKRYELVNKIMTTGTEVHDLATENFHLQNLEIAKKAYEITAKNRRDISTLILGLSEEGFATVKDEINLFRKRLLKVADLDKDLEAVYHLNFQFFPTSVEKKQVG